MVGGDDQPVRLAGRRARAPAGRDPRPGRERLRGCRAHDRRVPAVHPFHAARRRVGRPPAAEADPDRRRLRTRGAAPHRPDRVRRRRPHARAALRGRLPRRDLPGLLRRRVHVVPPGARRPRPDHRRELEVRGQPFGGAGRRARSRWRARAGLHRALRGSPRCAQLPRVRPLHRWNSQGGATARGRTDRRSQAEHVDRAEGGPPLRPRQPEPPRTGRMHGDIEPLLERRVRGSSSSSPFASSTSRPVSSGSSSRPEPLGSLAAALTSDANHSEVRDRADVDRLRRALRPDDAARRLRTGRKRGDPVPRRRDAHLRVHRRRLQHRPGQLPAGDLPADGSRVA